MLGVEAIIHLAALSNDPLGELSPGLTEEINLMGTLKIAELAQKTGVKRFIYSSSQSMYGISTFEGELDEYNSEKNPITSYAITKWDAEVALNKLQTKDFLVTSFRPSTVFGASPRLRCDIVFNNLVASAYTTGKIEIMSDGSPWRPVVHVRDVCLAILAGLHAPTQLISGKAFNVGIENGNYTVKDLAEVIHKIIPNSRLVFTGEHLKDSRTYKVSFKKILTELKEYYKPQWNLEKGAVELLNFFKKINFNESQFRSIYTNRLHCLSLLISKKKISNKLKLI